MVGLLLSHKGINEKDIVGTTALYAAAADGYKKIAKLLWAHAEIDLAVEDDKRRNLLAQVDESAQIPAEEESVRQETEERGHMQKERQATLKLLRSALEDRSQHGSHSLKTELTST